ncbi:hypothetical protein M6B38_280910 [Iris pallida]|uniref:Uncharacterized protein n=1 Tax=Iris pallida TaxID=29817 RepID=A0AAX6I0E6_IRIPA|nr:hypothetical protein M6B38_280910 [Iris pallida]
MLPELCPAPLECSPSSGDHLDSLLVFFLVFVEYICNICRYKWFLPYFVVSVDIDPIQPIQLLHVLIQYRPISVQADTYIRCISQSIRKKKFDRKRLTNKDVKAQ